MNKFYIIIVYIVCFAFAEATFGSAPNFTLNTLKGNDSVSLNSLRGKVVLIDFWASWCEACRLSFPAYNKLYQNYAGQGFTIIGINQDREIGEALKFLDRIPARFIILSDPNSVAANLYNSSMLPTSFLIDRNGNIVKTYEGYQHGDEEQMAQDIQKYLAAKANANSKVTKAQAAPSVPSETED